MREMLSEFAIPPEFAELARFEAIGTVLPTTALPGWEEAWIPVSKLTEYALSPTHKDGQHKANIFREQLGIEGQHWRFLHDQLLEGFPGA